MFKVDKCFCKRNNNTSLYVQLQLKNWLFKLRLIAYFFIKTLSTNIYFLYCIVHYCTIQIDIHTAFVWLCLWIYIAGLIKRGFKFAHLKICIMYTSNNVPAFKVKLIKTILMDAALMNPVLFY